MFLINYLNAWDGKCMTVITVIAFQFAKDFDLLEMKLNIVITISGPGSCLRKLAGGIIGQQVLNVKVAQVALLNVEG